MQETFLVFLTAHILGDFVFQSDRAAQAKEHSLRGILKHSLIITVITILIAGYFESSWSMLAYPGVFVAHFLIDSIKEKIGKNGAYTLLTDQGAHLATLILISYLIPDIADGSVWMIIFPNFYFPALIFVSGLGLCVFAGAVLVSKFTQPLMEQVKSKISGLENGGYYIGQLERALIFFFMLSGQTSAIGFLFAAKSILRFGEIKAPQKRKEAEYIIIGTFLSFGWALFVSYLTLEALGL